MYNPPTFNKTVTLSVDVNSDCITLNDLSEFLHKALDHGAPKDTKIKWVLGSVYVTWGYE